MDRAPWYVTQARDALEMGYRYIGAKLNAILAERAPGLIIRCDPLRPTDDMRTASSTFRRTLTALRHEMNLPESDMHVMPWTLGYINGGENEPWNIAVDIDWRTVEPTVLAHLRKSNTRWTSADWKELIVDPIEKQFADVNAALDHVCVSVNRRELRDPSAGIMISWQGIAEIETQADRLATSDLSILILGETGTGKEHLARRLHAHSDRAKAPFVPVNCASLPKERIESELFGHVRGAFTGAERESIGRVREARGGTILLDEIGDLPSDCWPNLLRFLQSHEIQPLGGIREHVDVRIIAATNKHDKIPPEVLHRFDYTFRLPPLSVRREDIRNLANEFFDQAKKKGGLKSLRFPIEEQELLAKADYPWPGNIRELEKAIKTAVVLHSGDRNLTAAEVLASAKRAAGLA